MSKRPTSKRTVPAPPATGLWWRLCLIVIAGILAYSNSLSGPFVFDDNRSIVENSRIREWWSPATVLFPERHTPVAGRPVVNVSFAVNYALGGLEVTGYHVWNIAVHLCCALLVFGVVRRTLETRALRDRFAHQSVNLAFAASLLWTLHPLNTEAVDYLTQRTESMMALFYLLTMYASIRVTGAASGAKWQWLAIMSCLLGMACKESMVTAPLMIVLHDRVFSYGTLKDAFRARWRLYCGLAMTWLFLAALVLSGPRTHSAGFSAGVSPWMYLLNQTVMITQYLRLTAWPCSLVANYGTPLPLSVGDVMSRAVLTALIFALTAIAFVRRPILGFPGVWFFVTLAPTSSVVPIATEVGAERRMYLPLVALLALAVVGASKLYQRAANRRRGHDRPKTGRTSRLAAALAFAVISTGLAAGTMSRNREYSSGLSLALTTLERWPTGVAHHMVGMELALTGRHEEAIEHLRLAVRDHPRAHYDLGGELFNQGKLDEAIDQLQAFVNKQPLLLEVVSARGMMGRAFARQRRWPEAIEQFRQILVMAPSNVDTHSLLGDALFSNEQFEEAIAHYRQYLMMRPNDVAVLTNLGVAMIASGNTKEAVDVFRRAVDTDPQNADARTNLANALFDENRADEAVVHAREAAALKPDSTAVRKLLGRALVRQGSFDEARKQFDMVLRIDPADAEARESLRLMPPVRQDERQSTGSPVRMR